MSYRYPIYRANDANLRRQIMEALESVAKWPVIQTYVGPGDYAVVPEGSQMIVYGGFLINGGFLELNGELVILGAAYRDEHEHPPYTMATSAGLYEYDGADAIIAAHRTLQLGAGSYTLTGSAADFGLERALVADSGTYTYTGADAALTGP